MLSLLLVLFLASCSGIKTNMSETMVDFEFTTEDHGTLSLDNLEGEWWIASFIYTNCRAICPRTTTNLVIVQNDLKELDLHPEIVSFSIDPERDTPEVLTDYAEEYQVDLENWTFLTGYDFDKIKEISEGPFKTPLSAGGLDQRAHGYHIFLVNPEGDIIKKYNAMDLEDLDNLVEDLEVVL